MSDLLILRAELSGGPGDGARLPVSSSLTVLLAALGRQVHLYVWANRTTDEGRHWVYEHRGVTLEVTGMKSASEVLAGHGRVHVRLEHWLDELDKCPEEKGGEP